MKEDSLKRGLQKVSLLDESIRKELTEINIQKYRLIGERLEKLYRSELSLLRRVQIDESYNNIKSEVSKILKSDYNQIRNITGLSDNQMESIVELQSSVSMIAGLSKNKDVIGEYQAKLASYDIPNCKQILIEILNKPLIEMPELAILRNTSSIELLDRKGDIPYGLVSNIDGINKEAIMALAGSDKIAYSAKKKSFVKISDETITATVPEMNMISSARNVLSNADSEAEMVSEEELMDFMNFLDEEPMMAMDNVTGEKIYKIVSGFKKIISFDKDEYYHCRTREKDTAPYVWAQMKSAPYGVTKHGRYNITGQAFFYFCDTKDGAEEEIRKHFLGNDGEDKVLQTVRIRANGEVKLIDLSPKSMRRLNAFLKYIRFQLDGDSSTRPRVYLIPSFVSQCCLNCGYDGIKYYGGKDYSNYVTWKDSYFDFVGNC